MPRLSTSSESTRYAIVTGAGSGLGRAFCWQLANQGWHVGVTDVDLVAAEKTKAELVAAGGRGQVELLDVTSFAAWQRLLDKLRKDWPRLDLLVNNAGVCGAGEIGEAALEDFHAIFDVNFSGVLNGCQAMVPWLKENPSGGQIVNVASIFGLVAPPTMAAYNTSKAAVVALSETLSGELVPHKVGVTVVAPGFFASQLVDRGRFDQDEQQQIAEQYMLDAQLTAAEVVEKTLAAVERRQLYVVLGRKARWIWRLKRWLPSPFARMLAWRYRRKVQSTHSDDSKR